MKKHIPIALIFLFLSQAASSCTLSTTAAEKSAQAKTLNFICCTATYPIVTDTPQPSIPAAVSTTPNPQTTPMGTPITPDTGWLELRPGMERRSINIIDSQNRVVESLYILRVSQSQFRLDIAFNPIPQSLESWQRDTGAMVVVNGGYYLIENERYYPTGLTIIDGKVSGTSYEDFAGMLAIDESGAELRWLANQPYDPDEPLQAAMQSFPILVKPGGELGFSAEYEDNIQARRTVIGQDKEGNILFIVASKGIFTLHQISAYLTESDLGLDIAVNLDGGPSSGIFVDDPREGIPAQTSLPFVILVYSR